jgi:ABC-type Fe3+ transport system permease subunit
VAGLRFACTRALPVIGWLIIAELLVAAGYAAFAVPGVYLSVVLPGPLFGVVILERGGIGRCFQLTKGRFWATFGRLCSAGVVVGVCAAVLALPVGILVALLASAHLSALAYALGGIAYAVLMIPALVLFAAVYLVTYAELRYRENPATTTAVLAAEMVRP